MPQRPRPIEPNELCIVVHEPHDVFRANVGAFLRVTQAHRCPDCGGKAWEFKEASREIIAGYLDSTTRFPLLVRSSRENPFIPVPLFHENQLVPIRDPGPEVEMEASHDHKAKV